MARVATLKNKKSINESLKGFEVSVNEFGEVKSTLNIDEMNAFLNSNVFDKKLNNTINVPKASDDYEALDDDFEDDDYEDDDDAFDDFEDDYDDEDLDDIEGVEFDDEDGFEDDEDFDDEFEDDAEEDYDDEE